MFTCPAITSLNSNIRIYTDEELRIWKLEVQEFMRLLAKEDLSKARSHRFSNIPKGKSV